MNIAGNQNIKRSPLMFPQIEFRISGKVTIEVIAQFCSSQDLVSSSSFSATS